MRTPPRSHFLSRALVASLIAIAAAACAPPVAAIAPAPIAPPPSLPAPIAPAAPATPIASLPIATPAPLPIAHEPPIAPELAAAPRDHVRAVVLLYHLFGAMDTELAVEPSVFEEQMTWLVEHHVPVISTSDLVDFLEGARELPERVAVIQIDDGHVSVRSRAYPILKRHGLPFTVALNTEAIEGHRPEAMTWDGVREMLSSGLCEIASHSHIHGHMERLTNARNRTEATLSRSIIEARTGVRPEAFVFPFGGNDERVRRTIEDAGYRAAFAASGGTARASSPRFEVPRFGVARSTSLAAFARIFGVRASEARRPRHKSARHG